MSLPLRVALHYTSRYDRPMWSADRLHPGHCRHRLLARSFAELLARREVPVVQSPSLVPTSRPLTRAERFRRMATRGALREDGGSAWA